MPGRTGRRPIWSCTVPRESGTVRRGRGLEGSKTVGGDVRSRARRDCGGDRSGSGGRVAAARRGAAAAVAAATAAAAAAAVAAAEEHQPRYGSASLVPSGA